MNGETLREKCTYCGSERSPEGIICTVCKHTRDGGIREYEFQKLRDEIQYRTTAQLTLITTNVVAVTAIVGWVLAGSDRHTLLLIIPIVSSALGFLFVDHALAI